MGDGKTELQQEHDDLVSKCDKLIEFRKTDIYDSLSGRSQGLVDLQRFVMLFYLDILGRRLTDLGKEDDG